MIRILIFSLIVFLSTILWPRTGVLVYQATGYKDFSKIAVNPQLVLPWKIGSLIIIVFLIFLFFKMKDKIKIKNITRITSIILLLFFYLSHCLYFFQVILYDKAYLLPVKIIYAVAVIFFITIIFLFLTDYQQSKFLMIITLILYIYFYLIHLIIPFDVYSDMLIMIKNSCENFLSAKSPYDYYNAKDILQCSFYLPGVWLSFVPFKIFNIDLRIGNLFYMLLFYLFLFLIFKKENSLYYSALLSIFFLNPWLILRHEIYLGAFLWQIAFFAYSLKENKMLIPVCLGMMLATYQIGWLLWILYLVFLYKNSEKKYFFKTIFISLAIVFLIFLPFIIQNFKGFFISNYLGTFIKLQKFLDTSHYNLSEILPQILLLPIQIIIVVGAILWILKNNLTFSDFFKVLAIVLGIFFLANAYSPHYFWFIFLTMILLSEIFSGEEKTLYS